MAEHMCMYETPCRLALVAARSAFGGTRFGAVNPTSWNTRYPLPKALAQVGLMDTPRSET